MKKGMAYTTFAILAAGVIMTIILLPSTTYETTTLGDETLITQASFSTNSIQEDKDRVHSIALERSMAEAKSQALTAQEPLENPEQAITEIKVEGEYQNQPLEFMENASIKGWFERVERATENAGYNVNYYVHSNINYTEQPEDFTLTAEMDSSVHLNDPNTRTNFNRTKNYQNAASFAGLEDPMIRLQTGDIYGHIMTQCTFEDPATQLTQSETHSNSIVHGETNQNPTIDEPEDHEGEILIVTGNIEEEYDPEDTQEFNAVITEEGNPEEYNDHYAVADTQEISDQISVTISDDGQVWNTRFREMIETECYLTSDQGPTFLERLQNQLETQQEDKGLLSLVDKEDDFSGPLDDSDTNVDYINLQEDSAENLEEIKGITFLDQGEERSNFLLDSNYIEEWEIQDLTE